MVLVAPVAAATPESDADGAITQAWDTSGGPTGPLGPKDGGVYPVGEGFGQNFAGGKIFFTPATGAHIMHGAILEKYESLGGPADSDLGFPTIDEGPGRIGPDSRNTTFSAGGQAGDLLDAGHRRQGGARRHQRRLGQARRLGGTTRGARRGRGLPRRRRHAEVHRRRAVVEPADQGLHDGAARAGRTA